MEKKLISSSIWLLRASGFAAIASVGFALSTQCLFAQAIYNYTGNSYAVAYPPYNTSMSVTATLQVGSWLPPNLTCIDPSTMPGFRLLFRDGVNTLDTNFPPIPPYTAAVRVSTDAHGQITEPWSLTLYSQTLFVSISSDAEPAGTPAACQVSFPAPFTGDLAESDIGVHYAYADTAGTWTYPSASVLTTMLTKEVNLQQLGSGKSLSNKLSQIADDITNDSGMACSDLAGFAGEVKAQTGKQITVGESAFILHTTGIMRLELGCGG
jgi:hypothetical protein